MFNKDKIKPASEIYFSLCKRKKALLNKPKAEEAEALLTAIQLELLCYFESEFLNACYSVCARFMKTVNAEDCDYVPKSFRVTCTDKPYALSSYDAFYTIWLLNEAFKEADISENVAKWLDNYLGESFACSTPANHSIDACLKSIDELLIQEHLKIADEKFKLQAEIAKDSSTKKLVRAAQLEADRIIRDAEAKRDDILAKANQAEQQSLKLRRDGELAARKMYDAGEAAERTREKLAQEILEKAQSEAKLMTNKAETEAEACLSQAQATADSLLEKARVQADDLVESATAQADSLVAKARSQANTIKQEILDEKHDSQSSRLRDGIDALIAQFTHTQEVMRDLEAQFDQVQLMKIFGAFYSLYDIITLNKESLKSLPEDYSYITENMDAFLEIIQDSLADFGIQTVISQPETPYSGKLHTAPDAGMFDPATAVIRRSLRPGFINRATGNVLKKEHVEIISQ